MFTTLGRASVAPEQIVDAFVQWARCIFPAGQLAVTILAQGAQARVRHRVDAASIGVMPGLMQILIAAGSRVGVCHLPEY